MACSGSDAGSPAADDVGGDGDLLDTRVGSDDGLDGLDVGNDDTGGGVGDGGDGGTSSDVGSDGGDAVVVPTGGCGKAAKAGVTSESITVGTLKRTYVLSIPTGYDPAKPIPLATGWHGRTGNGAGFRSYSGVEIAAAGKAIFVYPDGLPVTATPTDTGWDLSAKGRDVALFDALVTDISAKLCVDQKKIFAFGFSFGGYMSNALGCARTKALRAIAPVAGGPSTSGCGGAVAAWLEHATDDPVVNITEGTKSRDFWIKQSGCDATKSSKVPPDPCIAYASCSATAPVVWCERPIGGHTWPSFGGTGVWNFFASLP